MWTRQAGEGSRAPGSAVYSRNLSWSVGQDDTRRNSWTTWYGGMRTSCGLPRTVVCLCYTQTFICLTFRFSSTPSPPNRVVTTQPCTANILEFNLIVVLSKDKEALVVAMAVREISYYTLGTFFLLFPVRRWPHGLTVSRSLDSKLPGSFQRSHSPPSWNSTATVPQFWEAHLRYTAKLAPHGTNLGPTRW